MKNYLTCLFAALTLTVMLSSCAGTVVVRERPVEPVYSRPPAPGPDYVWIDGEWNGSHGHYNYHQGYWAHNRPGHTWNRGHWDNRSGGYVWIKGGWN